MLSNWTPRAQGTGQRRGHPGIFCAPNPRPKRSTLESSTPPVPNSPSSSVSGGYPDTSRSLHSFRPANVPDREYVGNRRDWDSGLQEIREHAPTTPNKYSERMSYSSNSLNEWCNVHRDVESWYWRSGQPSAEPSMHTKHYPRTTGSLKDAQSMWSGASQEDPRLEHVDITTRYPLRQSHGAIADDLPVYTTPSQDWKYSDHESPSTAAPDSNGNSSDSDVPPIRRGFTSEDSPDGSSDSDVPASTDTDQPPSPEVPSLVVPSSDEVLSSSDEAPSSREATARLSKSEDSQRQHPLAVIGWTGDLPLYESSNTSPTGCAQQESPHKPPSCVFRARNCAETAKRISKALDTELRNLEEEMRDLTDDLIGIRRAIPSRNADNELVFSTEH